MESLIDTTTGCYVVTTESSSRYWMDLDRRLLRRVSSASVHGRLRLRRDDEVIDLVEVVDCRLGKPMVLLIDLGVPGVWFTTRRSTAVVRIDEVPRMLMGP
jgi:hypothetical protein